MDRTNITTTYGVYCGEKVSPLRNAKQADATNLHGSGNGLDSQPSGTEGAADAPSASPSSEDPKVFMGEILRDDWSGVLRLKSLRRAGRLPFKKKEMSSKEILDILMVVLEHSTDLEFDDESYVVEIFKLLVLGENPMIDPSRLSREDFDILASKLCKRGPTGTKCLADLINDKMSILREARDSESSPVQILKDRLWKIFLDGMDDGSRADVHTKLEIMPFKEARGIWQRIANEVAVDYFDGDGHVDVERLRAWKEFLGNAEIFKKEPFCFIPYAELMRSQMYGVCECLFLNQNGTRDRLDAAAGITVGQHGRDILDAMAQGMELPLNPGVAILASLFTPHRQLSLPTCIIDSLFNAEIRNHPERLIEIYMQMLSKSQFTFPSGCAVQLQPIVNGSITVDLKNGGEGKKVVFEAIVSGDPDKIDQQIKDWKREGVGYVKSADKKEKYKLKMPIRNMNDVLFTHFLRESNYGNWKMCINAEYGIMLLYAGHRAYDEIYSREIPVDGSNFLPEITKLQKQAEIQRHLGDLYICISTASRNSSHAENIDIDALLAFDPNNMELGKAYPIGDRNWADLFMSASRDIPHLAVRKVDDTPTFEFGTLWDRSTFQKKDITRIRVFNTKIERFAPLCSFGFFMSFLRRLRRFPFNFICLGYIGYLITFYMKGRIPIP
ncbi:MAG: hypothetical protein LBF49_02080 [Puniceicoccales bacterium]|jgi:hypothetical protein|nr:hypothetical protein [Puniceicoccales bacterium]